MVYEKLLSEQKKTKLCNEWHFMEKEIPLLPKYIKRISIGVFLCLFVFGSAGI
jgi:hypothetical protein